MKRHICVCALVWSAALNPALSADDCSVDMIEGRYAIVGQLWDLRNAPPTPASFSGAFVADGKGRIAEYLDVLTAVTPQNTSRSVFRDLVAEAKAAGSAIIYEVEPDCRVRIQAQLMTPFGVVPVHLEGALAAGGREILLSQVNSPLFVSTSVAKSVRDPVGQLGQQSEAIKALLDRPGSITGLLVTSTVRLPRACDHRAKTLGGSQTLSPSVLASLLLPPPGSLSDRVREVRVHSR